MHGANHWIPRKERCPRNSRWRKEGMMVPQGGPEHGTSKGQPQVGSKEFPKGKAS